MTELPNVKDSNVTDVISRINNTVVGTAVENVTHFIAKHFNTTKPKDKTKDPNYNPTLHLQRFQASWKHVSENDTANSTEVVETCKFSRRFATCSIEYSAWNSKLWFKMEATPDKKGINVTIYEGGTKPRITFTNKKNGTDCQRFENGTYHQICLKVYGYETELGPTRVCVQIGAALFNKGVSSADFGCFRYGSDVRHEDPAGGEQPNPDILKRYILANNYNNLMAEEKSTTARLSASMLQILIATAFAVFLLR